ncbi:MAG: efflux RND transporter permease subunit [Bdellovibrionaceae bacterium]|nr:efflux RND transporter permease subunit [Pseudobdellovibrionaceae bacterium]
MNLSEIAIKRPVFIICLVLLMLILGYSAMKKMPVDQFPDVTFPIVSVVIQYPGASPSDMEKQVSKIVEDALSSLPGLDAMTSNNYDSQAVVVLKFRLGADIKDLEQQIRNRVGNLRAKLPLDSKEPVIRRFDPADQPVMRLAVNSSLDEGALFDIVDEKIKPMIDRIVDVGQVNLIGGRKTEIQVLVDRKKLQERRLSMLQVAKRIEETSKDIPIGRIEDSKSETVLRTSGEFANLEDLKNVSVNFLGSDRSVKLTEIAQVKTSLEEQRRKSFLNGRPAIFLDVFKQSGANTVAVADRVAAAVLNINGVLKEQKINAEISMVRDGAIPIRLNVMDVRESITFGIILCVIVVFFFLGSARSTFITGMALPNSLLGGFILMAAFGFTINIMTLLALSLAVGLLIDDAIVVRENIFRHLEMGKTPIEAALVGTKEVTLAVIATTLVVIAVFGPVSFVPGMVGQFFKQFGLTVVFTMIISLFDALTVAPMLSAYLATPKELHKSSDKGILAAFDRLQTGLENLYEKTLRWTLGHRKVVLLIAFGIFVGSLVLGKFISKTFLPPNDIGEFQVSLELPTGTSLEATDQYSQRIEQIIKAEKYVRLVTRTVGSIQLESNKAEFYISLVPAKDRSLNTTQAKVMIREKLEPLMKDGLIQVSDYDISGQSQKPLNLFLVGDDLDLLSKYANSLVLRFEKIPGLVDVTTNFRSGKPEYHVVFDREKSEKLGVSTIQAGLELRARTEGVEPAIYRKDGIEYKIRVKLEAASQDLRKLFGSTDVPNQNFNMIPLSKVAKGEESLGFSQINRQNKGRFIAITGNLGPQGQLGDITSVIEGIIKTELKPPSGVAARFEGQAQDFIDLRVNMTMALGLAIVFIFLVLASLYESFITPLTILLALPMAVSGALVGLLIFGKTIDIFSIIGLILLLGVVAKNSILLVDYTLQLLAQNLPMNEAILKASRTRLRPILMTSLALMAGTLPIAIGITELGSQRQSMGIAIISGVLSSTLLTLIVVPAAFEYIDRFRIFVNRVFSRLQQTKSNDPGV